MNNKLLSILTGITLFLTPGVAFGQTTPTLGTVANFVLFTTAGAMTNSGVPHLTHLTGNVGSNLAASISGFGNVDGQMHDFDVASGNCATDLLSLYGQLNGATPTATIASTIGGGATLTEGVYHILAATTLGGNLNLDAGGNPNALFIFQIDGPLAVSTLSKVNLVNGALACNVFWKVDGMVSMASGATMRGNIVAYNAAISMGALDTLEGRALSINGAVTVSEIMAYMPIGCGSTILTGPIAPTFVASGIFGVFSSSGAVSSTPTTYVYGDVGSNSTITTGFIPSNVSGTIHTSPDAATGAAAGDLTNVYNYLNTLPADIDLTDPSNFGFNLVLTPHTYLMVPATFLNDTVFLNAEGDDNAVFVIRINGAFTTTTSSYVKLLNGAQAKNVYWLINGAVHIFDNSVFNGTIVSAGAITTNTGDSLNGRALTINGAVAINGSDIGQIPIGCAAPAIEGSRIVCPGGTTTVTDSTAGGTWTSSNISTATIGSSTGVVTGIVPGTSTIEYITSTGCTITTTVTVNTAPNAINGPDSVCTGSSVTFSDSAAGGTWSSSNSTLATVGSSSGIVNGIATGVPTITYSISTSCFATKTVSVKSSTGTGRITGASTGCVGTSFPVADTTTGGTWTSSNRLVATIGSGTGIVTGVSAGTSVISYSVNNTCGMALATKTITITTTATAGTITGPAAMCVASDTTFISSLSGGTWTSGNPSVASIGSITGVAAGASAGTAMITYTLTSSCGTAMSTTTVSVTAPPMAGIISGPSSVCAGAAIVLTDPATGGIWSSSNNSASVIGGTTTGITAGVDTIMYTVSNLGCSAYASKILTVNATGIGILTGASSVCTGSSTTFSDLITGGTWSASNATASVAGGVVRGVAAGVDTIEYSITGTCGTASATKTITVNASPSAGFISGPSSVCAGAAIVLTDPATGGTWSSSNTSASVAGGTVTGIAAGVDTVLYAVSNLSCVAHASQTVTINPLPSAGIINGLPTVCVGAFDTLSDAVTGGVWRLSNLAASLTGNIAMGVTPGADTAVYEVITACGSAIAIKPITINPLPDADVITGFSSVCVGSNILLSDTADATGGTWSSSNAMATVSLGVVSGMVAGIDTIGYTVSNGCGIAMTTKAITINPLPDAGVISGPSEVCAGSSVTLTDAVTDGTWSSLNTLATVAGGLVTGVTNGLDSIGYSVTNSCGTARASIAMVVNAIPSVPIITTQGPSTACTGTMYQNFGTSTPPVANTTYEWTASNATVWAEGSEHQYSLINFNEGGAAIVTLNVTATGTACVGKSMVAVMVGPDSAQNAVVYYFNNHFVCSPSTEGSYQWGYDDVTTLDSSMFTGEVNQDYINTNPDFAHKYYWVMTTAGSCLQKTYYSTPLAVQNINKGAVTISVFPNPATSIINVSIDGTNQGPIQIMLSDMMGQKLNMVLATDNSATVDVSGLASGVYFISCYRNGVNIAHAQFVKN